MSRNFELMTQLGLQVDATYQPKPDAAPCASPSEVASASSGNAIHVGEEEMTRFILEMFPRGGSNQK